MRASWLIAASEVLEGLLGLNREADRDFGLAVEHLEKMTAEQAMKLALGAADRAQFDTPIAGVAFGTGDI